LSSVPDPFVGPVPGTFRHNGTRWRQNRDHLGVSPGKPADNFFAPRATRCPKYGDALAVRLVLA